MSILRINFHTSKGGDFMNLDVTQQNLYLFLPSKVSWMAEMLVDDEGIDVVEAINKIYQLIYIKSWKSKRQRCGIGDL